MPASRAGGRQSDVRLMAVMPPLLAIFPDSSAREVGRIFLRCSSAVRRPRKRGLHSCRPKPLYDDFGY
jgi:hypothetical protein